MHRCRAIVVATIHQIAAAMSADAGIVRIQGQTMRPAGTVMTVELPGNP